MGPGRRRSRRRGLIVGAAIGSARARRSDQQADDSATAEPVDVAAELQKLAELRDQDILTQEEFDAKKKQILGL